MNSAIIKDIWDQVTHDYIQILGITILVWDHCLTFGDEVIYIWSRPMIRSSYWFFLNRYLVVLEGMFVGTIQFSRSSSSSFVLKYYIPLSTVFNGSLVNFLLSLRIYALYNRSHIILCMIIASHSMVIGLSIWSISGQWSNAYQPIAFGQFVNPVDHEVYVGRTCRVIPWLGLLGHESLMFILLIWKVWSIKKQDMRIPLIDTLFRDGVIYYGVVCLAYLVNILTFFKSGTYMQGGLTAFSGSVITTMMSRMILNLHKSSYEGLYSSTFSTSNFRGSEAGVGVNFLTLGGETRQRQRRLCHGQLRQELYNDQDSGVWEMSSIGVELDTVWSEDDRDSV
ncbi:hypothetical protein K435DRAFT_196671 [Dendrothele bispora CBS 962.96]|uniref:DUF6533 domain-containing protein n=1 Tax=Dendrothele bispora (strain CBS 962.96) TaxID=1314807 RepID=A0A4S8MNC3_DENBC|nr:hypothetical protein K435DRAFT_196671 [Dendrothele bispora CBS 962.96]